jgi:protoporphyrinogen oxidase
VTPAIGQAPVLVAGGGPAGLTAAYDLVRAGVPVVVCERDGTVGGLARTEVYRGYRFDIGGHRFYTKVPEVFSLWREVLGDELQSVQRLSRIHYRGQFFQYPLNAWNVVSNLGVTESARLVLSYARRRLRPLPQEDTFEQWVTNRFGERLYETFFKTYTEKVWGIPCSEIRADWAAQRIRGISFLRAAMHALVGAGDQTSFVDQFFYPRLGPGQMWERTAELVSAGGGEIRLDTTVVGMDVAAGSVRSVTVESGGRREVIPVSAVISSLPLPALIAGLHPAPPRSVCDDAGRLTFRDFMLVGLIVDRPALFPDQWIYVHTPQVRVGRVQNFGNWSEALVPDAGRTSLGMEYFCNADDDLWRRPDAALIELASREAEALGFCRAGDIADACVIRQRQAYPVYDTGYRDRLDRLRAYLSGVSNLQTIGRNGMHRYNNQDHSMMTGRYAARNVLGERHDTWTVNTERSYYEDQQVAAVQGA